MIRFLQKDNRLTKALFVVVIAFASISMVVYLIPGLTGQGASGADTYAIIYPHWYSKFFSAGEVISQQKVAQMTSQRIQQQYPQYAGNPMITQIIEPQVAQQLVQEHILLAEADRLGVHASDDDVRRLLHTGGYAQVFFPDGKFIGPEAYKNLIATRGQTTVEDFESSLKSSITMQRLETLVTAGVTPRQARITHRTHITIAKGMTMTRRMLLSKAPAISPWHRACVPRSRPQPGQSIPRNHCVGHVG